MKKILVPTDFSKQAENAIKVAIQLAKKHNSLIYVLHSLDMPLHIGTSGDSQGMPESLYFIKLAENQFEELKEKPFLKGINILDGIGHNEIFEDINETVEKNNIDLIVMGSHGVSGFQEMFIGSNTEKVVRTAKIPVLVIKNEHQNFEIQNFAFATDFSHDTLKTVKKAHDFALNEGAQFHLLHINTPSGFKTTSKANDLMNDFAKNAGLKNYTAHIYNDISVEKGILNFAHENQTQLIGMSTHGRKGLAHFFNGSISEDLVNHANMPVITFKI
ncbi:MAG: universal stress protein [Flavobacteriales bacterium]